MARKKKQSVTEADMKAAWLEAFAERNDGRVSPSLLLSEAESSSCPFHNDFEWDDDAAAHQHRLSQAAQIIRHWKGVLVRVDATTKTLNVQLTRRVQSPESERGKGKDSFVTIEKIMADPALRADMLRTVVRELSAYRRRYSQLHELADLWFAIDTAVDQYVQTSATGDSDSLHQQA